MRVCLINAPTVTDYVEPDEISGEGLKTSANEIQLSTISLAAVVARSGAQPDIVNLNQLYYEYLHTCSIADKPDFHLFAAGRIQAKQADLYGFSSICSSYPLSLRIASELRRRSPESRIVFGGPQASVVDVDTLLAFPFVDFILRGEADHTFPLLLAELQGRSKLDLVPGLTFRKRGRVTRNPNAPPVEDLDRLPLPAYHLVNNARNAPYLSLELGRGCPFACKFCSTNDFFRRNFRVKSPGRVLEEMRLLAGQYNVRHFELVHDMFTVDRKRVVAFCETMKASAEAYTWTCSARTDCVDEPLLQLMASAGCTGIFYGVEVGSARMQAIIDKHLDLPQAGRIIDATERAGIHSTVSLISGFPEETGEDLRETLAVYLHSVTRPKSKPQFNILAPLAATPLYTKHKDSLVLAEFCSDMSHQGRTQHPVDRLLIASHPDIFPNFYLIPTPHLDHDHLIELRDFLGTMTVHMRWLLAALHQAAPGILDVFDRWRSYRLIGKRASSGADLRRYYQSKAFRKDILAFIAASPDLFSAFEIQALVEYETVISERIEAGLSLGFNPVAAQNSAPPIASGKPALRPGACVLHLAWDIDLIIRALKSSVRASGDARTPTHYLLKPVSTTANRLVKIGERMADLLELCDGRNTSEEITAIFAGRYPVVKDVPGAEACAIMLESAVESRIVDLASADRLHASVA